MGSSIWQSQTADAPRISLEFVHHHAGKLRRSLRNERSMFYIIATAACGISAMSALKYLGVTDGNPMNVVFGWSALLFALALIGAIVYIQKHLRVKKIEMESAVAAGLMIYRSELERLIKLANQEWHVLVFFVPSYLTLLVGGLIVDQRPGKLMRYGLTIVAGVVSVCFAIWTGWKKRQCLQRELDAIASLK